MKLLRPFPLFLLFSCASPTKHSDSNPQTKTVAQSLQQSASSNFFISNDSLVITTEAGDSLRFGKNDFNEIVEKHPELYDDKVNDPDQTYYFKADKMGFNSEVGQDVYYSLYAYFLKQKNGIGKNAEPRKKLTDIYLNINSLYQRLQHGGTYFGHMANRIEGYAEYSIYEYNYYQDKNPGWYDITKQKALYIQSLRQLIEDETENDGEISRQEKLRLREELNSMVSSISVAISDKFYLNRAKEFQAEHYRN